MDDEIRKAIQYLLYLIRKRMSKFFKRILDASEDEIMRIVRLIVGVQCGVYVIQEYGVSTTYCIGPSMIPTMANTPGSGTLAIVDTFSYKVMNDKYKRGDVVICASPSDIDKNVCKRIAATAGDEVVIYSRNKNHRVHPLAGPPPSITIPPGHVWLAGDNAANSTDSRKYGPVSLALIKGRVFCKMQLGLIPFTGVESTEWPHDAITVKHADARAVVDIEVDGINAAASVSSTDVGANSEKK